MKKEFGDFPSVESLRQWLLTQSFDLDSWNRGQAKSVDHLFEEINNRESSIQLKPPLRVVNVVQVLISHEGKFLLELEQELDDKRTRKRSIPPSEKMKPGENCLDAAKRCLLEELQIPDNDVEILSECCKAIYQYRNSRSYPGLRTKYCIYRVKVIVKNLPEEGFWTEEKTNHAEKEIIRRFYWGWGYLKMIKVPD
ncbi:MAG: hypothetical protein CVU41_03405 [Chloroflexi bacterium HGW-Chloroflexi-3]|nr:MAG: hypothetical protein CVU41_03405 [Chloroflexi bacterium HGW-Chloroflexi-3]